MAGSYGSKCSEAQWLSNVMRTRSMTCAASIDDSRTFHSRPSKSAVCERFDEPTNAVVRPDARSSNHAFACSLVVRASNATRTSAPSATSSSTARFSVAPM
jgi:hypothetical protein